MADGGREELGITLDFWTGGMKLMEVRPKTTFKLGIDRKEVEVAHPSKTGCREGENAGE